jgi:hypothetical protein
LVLWKTRISATGHLTTSIADAGRRAIEGLPEHGSLYDPGAEPVQGFLARVNGIGPDSTHRVLESRLLMAIMKGTYFMRSWDEHKNMFLGAVGCVAVMALGLVGAAAAFLFLYPLAKYSYHY